MTHVVLSVTNDLFCDQRVEKTAQTLHQLGCKVLLVGRRYRNSPPAATGNFQTKRFHLFFRKGPLFYAEYNLRLLLFLLFHKSDLLVANDLDTLLPNYWVSRIKNIPLVYDSHEYFCGILEIQHKPYVKKIWQSIEKYIFPRLENIITVSQSIANQYFKEYKKEVKVVRNIPRFIPQAQSETRAKFHLPEDKFLIIFQGNAIHAGRGGEEIIEAIKDLSDMALVVVGQGDALPMMKKMVDIYNLQNRVFFIGRVEPQKLRVYTQLADIGVSFDKNESLNHYFSLPNKIFEYIHAGIPLLVSNLPERKKIVEQYQVGWVIEDLTPDNIAQTLKTITQNPKILQIYKENCLKAREILNWEHEEIILKQIYQPLIQQK